MLVSSFLYSSKINVSRDVGISVQQIIMCVFSFLLFIRHRRQTSLLVVSEFNRIN